MTRASPSRSAPHLPKTVQASKSSLSSAPASPPAPMDPQHRRGTARPPRRPRCHLSALHRAAPLSRVLRCLPRPVRRRGRQGRGAARPKRGPRGRGCGVAAPEGRGGPPPPPRALTRGGTGGTLRTLRRPPGPCRHSEKCSGRRRRRSWPRLRPRGILRRAVPGRSRSRR